MARAWIQVLGESVHISQSPISPHSLLFNGDTPTGLPTRLGCFPSPHSLVRAWLGKLEPTTEAPLAMRVGRRMQKRNGGDKPEGLRRRQSPPHWHLHL